MIKISLVAVPVRLAGTAAAAALGAVASLLFGGYVFLDDTLAEAAEKSVAARVPQAA